MLLDAAIKAAPQKKGIIFEKLRSHKAAYELLELIRSQKPAPKRPLYKTSELAIAEILHLFLEEYVARSMFARGIPFKYWQRERNEEKVTSADMEDIYKQLNVFTESFDLYPNKYIEIVHDAYAYPELINLILEYKVDTYDAVLISTALKAKCDYFITEDRIRKTIPAIKTLTLITPEHFRLSVLRK